MDILSFTSVWFLIILIITSFILEFFGFVFLIRSILHRKEECFNKYLKNSLLCFLIAICLFNLDKMFEFFISFSNFRIPFNTFNEIKVVNY